MTGKNMVIMNKGNLLKKDREVSIAGWIPIYDYGKVTTSYIFPKTDNTPYTFSNVNATISEISKFTENYLKENLPTQIFANNYSVYRTQILENTENGNALRLLLTPKINDIPFDYLESEAQINSQQGKNYVYTVAEALIYKNNDIEYLYGLSPQNYTETGEKTQEILSLNNAIDIINKQVTNSISFEISLVEFVYCPYTTDTTNNTQIARPSWKFTAYNANDNLTYRYYVDALTGEFRYTSLSFY
jgi:hypothetical protein